MNTFKIGDIVKFKVNDDYIPNDYSMNLYDYPGVIPHGNTKLGEQYKKEHAKIIHIYPNKYCLVTWKDINNFTMKLAFKPNSLILLKSNISPIGIWA